MKDLNRVNVGTGEKLPVKIVQFGEGNFLRAFVGYAFSQLNQKAGFNAGIAIVQPIEQGMVSMLKAQDGLYTLFMNGVSHDQVIQDKELISNITTCVNPYEDYNEYLALAREEELKFVISNTTESGIAYDPSDVSTSTPPKSFPGKLTKLLFERYTHFSGAPEKGLIIIPCELINYNADTLKEIILKYIDLWDLGSGFRQWLLDHNSFHNTLVDRIVPGYPRGELKKYEDQLAYKDNLIVTAESFFLWVIEGDEQLKKELPFEKTGLDVKIVDDMQPYRTRKVRILNGAHTAMVPFSLLYGNSTVRETIENSFTGDFIKQAVYKEIIDTLPLGKDELVKFANEIFDRFKNPFIVHQLSSIALNSISKFKVRVLPSLLGYFEQTGKIPIYLTYSFACLLQFYKGEWQGEKLPVQDSQEVTDTMANIWKNDNNESIATEFLHKSEFWGQDLTEIPGLTKGISRALDLIQEKGIEEGFSEFKESIEQYSN